MEYPTRLLPKSSYKIIEDSAKLKKFYLLHYVDPEITCRTAIDIKSNILNILIPGRFFEGLSCSLFSKIKIEDMKLKVDDPTNLYGSNWETGAGVMKPQEKEIHYFGGRKVVSMKMADLLRFKAKSTIGQGKDSEDVTISLTPRHSPININFWHYNIFLEVIKDSDKSEVRCGKDRSKRLVRAISDDLASLVHRSSKQQCRYIEKSLYKEKTV